ncbi:MAG: hypothetical protein R3D30_01910 [Hyphomicrobiales bacterium]
MTRPLTPSRLLLIAAALAVGVVAPLVLPAYQLQLTELLLFIVFALAWDLVGGQMGYNSFGNVLFVGPACMPAPSCRSGSITTSASK